jgi:hypothetical protein
VPWLIWQVHFLVLQELVEEDFPRLLVLRKLRLVRLSHAAFLFVYVEDFVGCLPVLLIAGLVVLALHIC